MTAFADRPHDSGRPAPAHDRWQDAAACVGMDTATFYAHDGQRASSLRAHEAAAKRICATCPVRTPCLQYALATREPWGIWGGQTAEERSAMEWRATIPAPLSATG
jgi:WhiB family redox-sensing transcriptional regulator